MSRAAKLIEGVLGESAFEGDAHALLMAVYKNTELPLEVRIDAAGKAIGYEKPRLSTVDATLNGSLGTYIGIPVERRDSDIAGSQAGERVQ